MRFFWRKWLNWSMRNPPDDFDGSIEEWQSLNGFKPAVVPEYNRYSFVDKENYVRSDD